MIEVRANGVLLDVKDGEKVKYTKQVADLADLSTSNASASNSFKLPKTPNNVQFFQMLGIAGDGSQIPYQKVTAQLLDNGIPVVKSGWLEVSSTETNYNANIKDGIIDFFKAIQGKKLGTDVDLSELNHVKDVPTVIASFNNEIYTYLINDYGGRTVIEEDTFPLKTYSFNIDYLVPSARIKYLWQRIFETIGFTYSGNIFENEDFMNAWLTFPKTNSETINTPIGTYSIDGLEGLVVWGNGESGYEVISFNPIPWEEIEDVSPDWLETYPVSMRLPGFRALQTSTYGFRLTLEGQSEYKYRRVIINRYLTAPVKVVVYKNGQTQSGWYVVGGSEVTIPISMEAGDEITFRILPLTPQEINEWLIAQGEEPINLLFYTLVEPTVFDKEGFSFEVETFQVVYAETDFNNTFKDFDLPSFIKEVMWRFALTAIPDVENNHVTFYTIDELLDINNGVHNWSDKYVGRRNEYYQIGSYAQTNLLKHKYNIEDASYNDGIIPINNLNLGEQTALLTSKTYSANENLVRLPVNIISGIQSIPVFPTPIWEQEVKEDSDGNIEVQYKGLTGRYYWVKKNVQPTYAQFKSDNLGEEGSSESFNVASVFMTAFRDLVPKYHQGHIRLLNDVRIHEIELTATVTDVQTIDFTRLYYFEQEASYYKLNKITWEDKKIPVGEFIRVKL